jgi:hypothetical protein
MDRVPAIPFFCLFLPFGLKEFDALDNGMTSQPTGSSTVFAAIETTGHLKGTGTSPANIRCFPGFAVLSLTPQVKEARMTHTLKPREGTQLDRKAWSLLVHLKT